MRADRLVNIMILLQNRGKMTTEELSGLLEVSPRTILRDMEALSGSGIPVVADRGKAGGWRLMDHFRSQLSGIKLADMKSLLIVPSDKILRDLGVEASQVDVRHKLLASMPSFIRDEAQHYVEKIYIDTGTWKPSTELPGPFQTVQQAVWEEKKLDIVYDKTNGEHSSRQISPLGLVAKGNAWYLIAMSDEGEYRSFRISRIRQAQMGLETFSRPTGFSLADYWKQSKTDFAEQLPLFQAKVMAHPSIISRMRFTSKFVHGIQLEAAADKQWVSVTLTFNSEQEIVEYVLGFGENMRLIHPEPLIDKIVQQAKAVANMYVHVQ
ncbi:YafY family transcriptional regulator [Paenibacillaceae bacterium]|nr:YafY family transcriptional regulator [Paenibacillaceae bacterium]